MRILSRRTMVDESWLILTRRYGGDVRSPSAEVVAAAIREVFVEDLPGMEAGDYEEHGEMYLRRGRDDGSMHVLRVDCLQRATLEEWADQDYGRELGSPRSIEQISQGDALNLCLLFARGDIAAVRAAMEPGSASDLSQVPA
jgi:hypothetical protein